MLFFTRLQNSGLKQKPGQTLTQALNNIWDQGDEAWDTITKLAEPIKAYANSLKWTDHQAKKMEEFYHSKWYTGVCITSSVSVSIIYRNYLHCNKRKYIEVLGLHLK